MRSISRILEKLAWVMVLIGGVGLFVSMFAGIADIVTTHLGRPIPGAYELTESVMVLVVFGGLAYAQIHKKHIRVELIYIFLGPRTRVFVDFLADLTAVAFFSLLVWQGWLEALYSWEIREATSGAVRLPLYPARFVLVLGGGLFVIQLLLDLIDNLKNGATARSSPQDISEPL